MGEIFRIGVTKLRTTDVAYGYKRVNLVPYMRVWPGRPDPIKDEIIERASNFHYLDQKGNISTSFDRKKNYMNRLTTFWGLPYIRLDLKPDLWKGENHSEFSSSDWVLNTLEIGCKGCPAPFKRGEIIWEGYKEENNFRDKFISQYIDDSAERVESVNISTFGNLEIQLKDRTSLDENTLVDMAVCFAIMQNIRYLEFK